jgi:DNA-binding transcriptional LysR family regulator
MPTRSRWCSCTSPEQRSTWVRSRAPRPRWGSPNRRSHGIAALERRLGGALFDRTTTGVPPTALANRVLPLLRVTLGSLDSLLLESRAATRADTEPLRRGISPVIHSGLVARAFQAARREPSASLVLREKDLADLLDQLLARRLALSLVPVVPGSTGCERREIDDEPLRHLPDDIEQRSGEPIELGELSDRALVMVGGSCGLTAVPRRLFAAAGARPRPYQGQAESYRSVEDWANLGLGDGLLPRSRFQPETVTRPVHHDGRPVTIHYEAQRGWPKHRGRPRSEHPSTASSHRAERRAVHLRSSCCSTTSPDATRPGTDHSVTDEPDRPCAGAHPAGSAARITENCTLRVMRALSACCIRLAIA